MGPGRRRQETDERASVVPGEPRRSTRAAGGPTKTGLYPAVVECDGTLCVVAQSELDLATAPVLHDALLAAEASSPPEILLDIEAVSFVDSTGLRTLLAAHTRSLQSGVRLRLTRGTAQARRLFALVACDDYLPFVDR